MWRETLERSGRLHDISAALEQLKRIGVRRVCWLRPNEEVRLLTVAILTAAVLTAAQQGVLLPTRLTPLLVRLYAAPYSRVRCGAYRWLVHHL